MRPKNEIHIINEGHLVECEDGRVSANGTATLVQSKLGINIVIDTSGPWVKDKIERQITKKHKIGLDEVHYVVCTHAHPDQIGNLNLFQKAIIILGYDIMHPGGTFGFHDFKNNKPFKITNTIDVIGTPGHTDLDLSVVVRETDEGTVAITGDLFINADDIEEEEIWRSNSTYPELQEEHRNKILRDCDVIIPGHGPAFRVDEFELVHDDSPTQQRTKQPIGNSIASTSVTRAPATQR